MAKRPTRDDRLTVLRNMGYEIDMLRGMQLLRSKIRGIVVEDIALATAAGWNHNALLEAQCVHVRTLLEFFYVGTDRNRIRAVDYVKEWETEHTPSNETDLGEHAGRLNGVLNNSLSHLNTPRTDKRVWNTLPRITEGLLNTVRVFDTLLDDEESAALRSNAPDIGWLEQSTTEP